MTEDLMAMTMEPQPGSLGEMLQESGLFAYMSESDLSHLHCVLRFAALIEARAVARTREECAALCEQWNASNPERLAAAIRALGERT